MVLAISGNKESHMRPPYLFFYGDGLVTIVFCAKMRSQIAGY